MFIVLLVLVIVLSIALIVTVISLKDKEEEEFDRGFNLAYDLYARNGETPVECCNCKKKFYSDDYGIKVVTKFNSLYNNTKYDAFDCPNCGRQNILGERI